MPDTPLITTSTEGFSPLGSAAQRSFELIRGSVTERLGPEFGVLFAEPVANETGDQIDWYGAQGAKPLADMSELDQQDLKARLGEMIGRIRDEANILGQSDRPDDNRLSEALKNATEVPDKAMIYGIKTKDGLWSPILVHWAWINSEQRAVRGVLTGMVPRKTPIVSVAGPVRRTSNLWWWLILLGWVVLAALLGAILYLVVAPCGVNRFGLRYCPAPQASFIDPFEEEIVLNDEIARLQRELALRDNTCQPSIPIVPQAPVIPIFPAPQEDASRTELDRAKVAERITERGAALGALNFVLQWQGEDDIDLYVTCPAGETISFSNREGCGGHYDLDANVAQVAAIPDPVENIVFENVGLGLYKVRAHLRENRSDGPKTVTLHVLRTGGPSRSYTGVIAPGQDEWVVNISISR